MKATILVAAQAGYITYFVFLVIKIIIRRRLTMSVASQNSYCFKSQKSQYRGSNYIRLVAFTCFSFTTCLNFNANPVAMSDRLQI